MLTFNADLYRIATACQSKDATCYYLCGVFVTPHAVKGVVMVTTDRHRLLCIHDKNGTADESAILALSPECLKACKTSHREHARHVRGRTEGDHCGVSIFGTPHPIGM